MNFAIVNLLNFEQIDFTSSKYGLDRFRLICMENNLIQFRFISFSGKWSCSGGVFDERTVGPDHSSPTGTSPAAAPGSPHHPPRVTPLLLPPVHLTRAPPLSPTPAPSHNTPLLLPDAFLRLALIGPVVSTRPPCRESTYFPLVCK